MDNYIKESGKARKYRSYIKRIKRVLNENKFNEKQIEIILSDLLEKKRMFQLHFNLDYLNEWYKLKRVTGDSDYFDRQYQDIYFYNL